MMAYHQLDLGKRWTYHQKKQPNDFNKIQQRTYSLKQNSMSNSKLTGACHSELLVSLPLQLFPPLLLHPQHHLVQSQVQNVFFLPESKHHKLITLRGYIINQRSELQGTSRLSERRQSPSQVPSSYAVNQKDKPQGMIMNRKDKSLDANLLILLLYGYKYSNWTILLSLIFFFSAFPFLQSDKTDQQDMIN